MDRQKNRKLSSHIFCILAILLVVLSIMVIPTAAEANDFTPGDVNGDGRINGADVALVRRYIAGGYGVEIDLRAADVNDDGRINGADVALTRRYIAGGYGVELQPSTKCFDHALIKVDAIASTCEKQGNIEYWYCSNCNKCYGDADGKNEISPEDTMLDALGHSYGDWVVIKQPTEEENGSQSKTCANCGDVIMESIDKLAHKHNYSSVVTAPTCTDRGYTTYTCSCGDSYVDNYVDAAGHTPGEWIVDREATYDENGEKHKECTVCGSTVETAIIPMLKHAYVAVVTAPTCTEKGYTTHTCSKCGDSYVDSYVDALGHSFGDWYEVTAPTCTVDGLERRDCTRCEYFETNVLGATGHTYSSVTTLPTCTERGYTTYTCSCGDSYVDNYVNATGHTPGEWIVDREATYDENGEKHKECTVCGSTVETAIIPMLKHSYDAVVTAPTCTEKGYTTHTCSKCGDSYVDSYVDALGHSFGDWYEVTAPTCITEGLERHDCTRCDHYETNVLGATGHNYTIVVTAPTATEDGYAKYTCSTCGNTYTRAIIPVDFTITSSSRSQIGYTGETDENLVIPAIFQNDGIWYRVTSIGENAFKLCTKLKSVTIPDSVTSIGSSAFYLCTSLTSIVIPDSVTSLGSRAFSHCDSLVNIKIGDSVTSIGEYEFYRCQSLTSVVIPDGVTNIGDSAFYFCSSLTSIQFEGTVEQWNAISKGSNWDRNTGSYTINCSGGIICKKHTEIVDAAIDATCTTEGLTEGKHCSVCNEILVAQTVVDKLSHTEGEAIVENNVAPTCTETGSYDNVVYCTVCGDELSRENVTVNALGHSYGEWYEVTAPTCTVNGLERHDCTRCDHYETNVLNKTGHTYNAVVTEPTCTEKGYTTYTCHCGDSYISNETEAFGHSYTSKVTTAPTYTTTGIRTYSCSACGDSYTKVIPAITCEHNYNSVVTAPTCTAQGYTTYTCSECGNTYIDNYTAKVEHTWGDGVVTTTPTCTVNGVRTYTCSCGATKTESEQATGHSYTSVVTEPTCTERGYTTHTCHCGDSYVDSYVDALGHDYGEWYEVTAPTCTVNGLERHDCSRCNHYETNVISATGHSYTSVVTAPTCTEQGYTTNSCHCGDSYVDSYVDALGHNFGEWVTIKEPTLEENGECNRECANCGYSESRAVQYGKGNSFYGYYYFADETNGTAKQKLYIDLYNICEDFANSDKDLTDLTLAVVDCDTYGLTLDEVASVWKILLEECPRYYWLSNALRVSGNSAQICVDEAYAIAEYRKECDTAIKSMVVDCDKILNAEMSELEKALAIHNFILGRMNYAYESDGTTPEDAIWAHNMIGCAKYNLGVCESYAEAYMYLCLLNEVECIVVAGETKNGEDHKWNLVSIDDNWYGVDCTWDETNEEDKLTFNCFGMSKSYTESTHIADKCNDVGVEYLYALPEISDRSIELVDLYKEDVFIGTFANIDVAFDEMTDSDSEYSLYLYSYDSYGPLLISSPNIIHAIESEATPKVKKINIYGTYTSIGNFGFNTLLYINNELVAFTETISIYDIALFGDGNLNIQDNCLTIEGNYSSIYIPIIGNIENDSSSKIVCNGTGATAADFYDYVQIHTMIAPRNVQLRDNAKIVDLKTGTLIVMGYGGTVEIENLYGDYEYCNVAMEPQAENSRLIIKNLFSHSEEINVSVQFGQIELYPYLMLGNMNCVVNIKLNGRVTKVSTDVNGEIIDRWTEIALPIDVTEPIVHLMYPEQFEQINRISYVESGSSIDYTHLYELNEENAVVLKEYTSVNDLIIMDGIVVYSNGDLKDVVIPESVVGIGEHAFDNNKCIESVIIPDSVTSISDYAFSSCTSLVSVTIGNSVTSIGERAFYGCTSLTSITIPDSVTSIGKCAFFVCSSLESVTMGNSVTSIGEYAFHSCKSLTRINFGGTVEQWNAIEKGDDWSYNAGAYTVYCADGEIAKNGTVTYHELEYTLNDDGTSYSVTGMGSCIDTDTNIIIPDMYNGLPVTSIGHSAFEYCMSLESVIIGNSVKSIGDDAFYNCTSLASITISDSVTSINKNAFSHCIVLRSIKFEGTVEQWNAINKESYWNYKVPASKVICSDGTVSLE